MSGYIIIDGVTYNVPVVALTETCDMLDKYAERVETGELKRELIGTYHNYRVEFGSGATPAEMAALWLKLTEAVEFHTVTVPDDGGDFTFTAYFANMRREIRKVDGATAFWRNLTADFIAKIPRRTP